MPSWNCCVINCKNNTHGPLRFFSFPKDHERRQLWAESCGRKDWYPTDLSRICEVHFDKSQFEQNQQDGKKLLKWCAIPRMYEEWNKDPSSPTEDHFNKSYEHDDVAHNEGAYLDYNMSQRDEMDNDSAAPEVEGLLDPDWRKGEKLKRKRTDFDSEQDSDRSEISTAKRDKQSTYAFERTDELEDELSRIKADIKRLMADTNTEKTSDVYRTRNKIDGRTANPRHISPISALMARQRSNLKESPGIMTVSPPSPQKHYLQVNVASLQPRQLLEHASHSNKISAMKTSHNSNVLVKQHTKGDNSMNESSSIPPEHVDYARPHPVKPLQRIEGVRKIGPIVIPTSQLPKKQMQTNVTSEKVQSRQMQSLMSPKQKALLKEIMSDTKTNTKKDPSDMPWRTPDEILYYMKNAKVCFAPGEKGTLSTIIATIPETTRARTPETTGARRKSNNPVKSSPSKPCGMQNSNDSTGTVRGNESILRLKKVEVNSLKGTTGAKNALPRIIKVQSLNLRKDAAEMKGVSSGSSEPQSNSPSKDVANESPWRFGEAENRSSTKDSTENKVEAPKCIQVQSGVLKSVARTEEAGDSNLLECATDVDETPSRTDNMESGSMSEDGTEENESPLRIIEEESNSLSKDTEIVEDTPSEINEVQSGSLLEETIETPSKSSEIQNKTALTETTENRISPEVPVRSTKTNGNVTNPPETKSAQLKKLLASMLSLEEDMFSDETNLEMLKNSNETLKKKKKKKLDVEVQTDDSQSEELTGLKAEIEQLKQQLEEKNKTIQQLEQSLAAILPPGQIIMLQSGNDEKYMVFNQQEAPS